MILNRRGSFVRRLIHAVVSLSLRLFFRRIETVNKSLVPEQGAVIFVVNHPNGLVDPSLIFVALPRKISFLAKSTLFRIPVFSTLLKVVEALPVYRHIDSADVSKNLMTFVACHDLLQKGGAIALFPEGISHNSPKLLPIKTGAARIALGAISGKAGVADFTLKIVPVGLYYTNKTTFRSDALLHFGEPFDVEEPHLDEDGDLSKDDVNRLTSRIESALREVTVNAESKARMDEAREGANLFFSVSETLDLENSIADRFAFVKAYLARTIEDSDGQEPITSLVSNYKKKLRKLGLEPENLSLSNEPAWFVFKKFVLRLTVLLLLFPLAAAGSILHFPAYQISKYLSTRYTHHGVDDIISTVKILSGIVLMPATWLIAAGTTYYFSESIYSLLVVPGSLLVGYVALRSWEEYAELRGWLKAAWLFFTKRGLFLELIYERRRLHKILTHLND